MIFKGVNKHIHLRIDVVGVIDQNPRGSSVLEVNPIRLFPDVEDDVLEVEEEFGIGGTLPTSVAASRTMSRPMMMCPTSIPGMVYWAASTPQGQFVNLTDVVQNTSGHDQVTIERRIEFRIIVTVFLGKIEAGPNDRQGMFEESPSVGMIDFRHAAGCSRIISSFFLRR